MIGHNEVATVFFGGGKLSGRGSGFQVSPKKTRLIGSTVFRKGPKYLNDETINYKKKNKIVKLPAHARDQKVIF